MYGKRLKAGAGKGPDAGLVTPPRGTIAGQKGSGSGRGKRTIAEPAARGGLDWRRPFYGWTVVAIEGPAMAIVGLGFAVSNALLLGTALGIFLLLQNVIWAHCYGRQGLGRVQGAAVMIGISASALDL